MTFSSHNTLSHLMKRIPLFWLPVQNQESNKKWLWWHVYTYFIYVLTMQRENQFQWSSIINTSMFRNGLEMVNWLEWPSFLLNDIWDNLINGAVRQTGFDLCFTQLQQQDLEKTYYCNCESKFDCHGIFVECTCLFIKWRQISYLSKKLIYYDRNIKSFAYHHHINICTYISTSRCIPIFFNFVFLLHAYFLFVMCHKVIS